MRRLGNTMNDEPDLAGPDRGIRAPAAGPIADDAQLAGTPACRGNVGAFGSVDVTHDDDVAPARDHASDRATIEGERVARLRGDLAAAHAAERGREPCADGRGDERAQPANRPRPQGPTHAMVARVGGAKAIAVLDRDAATVREPDLDSAFGNRNARGPSERGAHEEVPIPVNQRNADPSVHEAPESAKHRR